MLISFIIPVYNVEKYLRECVDSILNQSFTDYEIILVDDGSPDNSGAICDDYASKYDFIKVIHKENGGLSDARNTGIAKAEGKYILFVDSDDYIGEGSLEKIAEAVTGDNPKADVVFLEAFKVFPDKSVVPLGDGYIAEYVNGCNKETVMKHIASLPKYPGSACTKLIKSSVIKDNNLYFKKGLLSEDIDWTITLLVASNSFAYCDAPYYYYRQVREGSITNSFSAKHAKDLIYIIEKWWSDDLSNPFQKEINAFMAYEYIILLYNVSLMKKEEKKELKEPLKKLSSVLKFGQSKKIKLVSICYSLTGFNFTLKLLSKMK